MSDSPDDLRQRLAEALAERDKLQAFKDWVHSYLDRNGVPHHPPGAHGAAGCRIGDRMDWLMAGRDRLAAEVVAATQTLRLIRGWDCLNPPATHLSYGSDLPWLKDIVDSTLARLIGATNG